MDETEKQVLLDKISALDARIDGLQIVLSLALNLSASDVEVRRRLERLENTARQKNLSTETIAAIREFREKWTD